MIDNKSGTMEAYILKLIKELDQKIAQTKNDGPLFHYFTGQKNILYLVLTGHNNPQSNPAP